MKSAAWLPALAAALLCAAGCNAVVWWDAPVRPPAGLLYTHYRAPISKNASGVPLARDGGKSATKRVSLWFFSTSASVAWDDAGLQAAAREGGLSRIHYADYEVLDILGVYTRFTLHLYGE